MFFFTNICTFQKIVVSLRSKVDKIGMKYSLINSVRRSVAAAKVVRIAFGGGYVLSIRREFADNLAERVLPYVV